MAGIDHTRLVFKNGKLLTEDEIGYYDEENDTWVNLLPFEYGRDGNIYMINGSDIYEDIKWYRDEYDAIYERKGLKNIGNIRNISFWTIISRLKWIFHRMERVCYRKEVGELELADGSKLYQYHDPMNQSHASFYYDGVDSYVVLGGYGHWKNVYTHFMHRGYGEEFEEKMASEAYHWLHDRVLEEIAESVCESKFKTTQCWEEYERFVEELKMPYAKYDTYGREY